ncbi:undecaprenyl-diphosphate phosphatase [Dysgonomonas sp. 216]|uniref:undecaprenyl-diphosphate phosphatase n=1 Tax=Dysgonomonas sp. 216 TaxID=2302934 RepID=UPI0013D5DCCD|nr:undecaprenyl-diphosphate phosphatase [Dysgonomonas sp. 216]NDW18137.1 undecaprenyl-diphosphate phosphatase [Dysgonomonas sp. 216]
MSIFETIIIAIIEGLTEFLPVSSTGHMIITQSLLGVESTPFVKTFTVAIQFGAILSVLVLYWKRFLQSWTFYQKLFIGFIPAAIFGFLLNDYIDELLESVMVVSIMLILGGVVMLFMDKWFDKPKQDQDISNKNALVIGFFQCIAMIPGVSRSMATIFGGMAQGLTRKNAAEFSFFLAVPTMAAATGYKLLKLFLEPDGINILTDNIGTLILGNVVAFIVAMLAIKFFIGFISKYGFKMFGWYRIIVGSIILILLLTGHQLAIL